MLKAGDVNIDVDATVDLSKVTMRKHKKSNPKDVTGVATQPIAVNSCDTSPHVQVDNIRESIKCKHDTIEGVLGVSIKSAIDLDLFLKGIEAGKYPIWPNLDSETRSQVYEAMSGLMEVYVPSMTANATNSDVSGKDTTTNDYVEVNTTNATNSSSLVAEAVCEGVNVSIPRRIVEKVSARLEHTLYGYFIGNRMAFPVVDYYVKNNWAKYGLKKIMMNDKGFFFFKFDTQAGLESVLENGPWMIRKSPIILKKWSIGTSLCKEELTRIPIWVKLHDVPLQVFEDDGINLIASFIGKPIMLDSYTSSMCKDSWGRSSFARCLIEVGSVDELVEVITIGVPSLTGDGFTKESIRVEYEWRPPRCTLCKIFGHIYEHCTKKETTPPVVTTSNVVPPAYDGFQKVSRKKKKGKSQSGIVGTSVKQTIRYEPKKTTSEPKKVATSSVPTSSSKLKSKGLSSKGGEVSTSNPYDVLATDEDGEDDCVDNMFDESANLFPNVAYGGSSSFTDDAAG